jgi:hypothetical protein
MVILRLLAFSVLGGALAAGALFALQLYVLRVARVDLTAVSLATLLVDVMDLPAYAVFGAVLGALLAPFPGRGRPPLWRLLAWTLAGATAGLAAPTAARLLDLGHIPTVAELAARVALDLKYVIAGAVVGLGLSWIETAREAVERARLRRRFGPTAGDDLHDPDAVIKDYWRERAESYLARRERD